MTRDEAIRQIQGFFRSHGQESGGLNAKNLGGARIGEETIAFEFLPDRAGVGPCLKVGVLVYRFRARPKPQVLEAFRAEEKSGTDAGGGAVDYDGVARSLFLSRIYAAPVKDEIFRADVDRLMHTCKRWREEIAPRVAERANKNVIQ
jgi:hypothetical protein